MERKALEHTGFTDHLGNAIRVGDKMKLNFGIPPKVARFIVYKENGEFFVKTFNASPTDVPLKYLLELDAERDYDEQ